MTTFRIPKINGAFDVSIALPGSKSIALRQLALAALADGESVIRGIPACDDTDAMIECLIALGVGIQRDNTEVRVVGPMDRSGARIELDTRMSGASTRLLIGLAALRTGETCIDGHPSLRARTNAPLLEVLRRHGCRVESSNGCLPLTIQGPFTPPARFAIDGSLSSQYISALLIPAVQYAGGAEQKIVIEGSLVSKPYIDITLHEMAKRGVAARWTGVNELSVDRGSVAAGAFSVEGDATAATYFAALATLHASTVTLTNLGKDTVQGDYAFCDILSTLGAQVSKDATSTTIRGPRQLEPLGDVDMTAMPDAALTLIAMSALLPGTTTLRGLGSLHHKECDRLECPARELRTLGVTVATDSETITVTSLAPAKMRPHTLNTYHDHRMAMAFSLIGSQSDCLSVDDKSVVDKTYPNYWNDYARLVN